MQSLSQIGNARREERVLLPALIELRSELGDEALAADGIDVSPSGVSVRAAFVPEVGTRLLLSFRCPPQDDAVHALGEVVWSNWDGPRVGSFGMRFLELDTKSATAIRRYVAPDAASVEEPELPRSATMRIDGLGAPIEADVRLYDQACIVLEQELSFLRLGRGIEVDVPGRGKERGRIASIELRQGPLDTPTLVFGVLLDEKRDEVMAKVSRAGRGRQELEGVRVDMHEDAHEHAHEDVHEHAHEDVHVHARVDEQAGRDEGPRVEVGVAARVADGAAGPAKRRGDEPRVVRVRASERAAASVEAREQNQAVDEDVEFERALQNRMPEGLAAVLKAGSLALAWLRLTLVPALVRGSAQLFARGESESESKGEQAAGPSRLLVTLARMRAGLAHALQRFWKGLRKRRTTAAVPRVQRSAAAVRPQQRVVEPVAAPRSRRWLTVSLAALGVGLGVYALAPRSGADRIRVPRAEPSAAPVPAASLAPPAELAPSVSALPAPVSAGEARGSAREQELASVSEKPVVAPEAASDEGEPSSPARARFGEANVPNGRVFVLRMSGPVKNLEGEAREDGFNVRIPGRLALDRASPIATSHRSVARALILNRGEYAELTVEFLPGMRPKYQVTAKDSSIEVTLERL
jgi:hypothetical protein